MQRIFVLFVLWIALHAGATLADGIYEINQLCVSTGCFAGDAPGFPVEVSGPGSYRLTSNLNVPEDARGIALGGTGISLDLGGYAVLGSVACTGDGPSCTAGGPSNGIVSRFGFDLLDSRIFNGTVSGMGGACIDLNRGSGEMAGLTIRNVNVSNCAGDGIELTSNGMIDSVSVRNALGHGVEGNPALVTVRNSSFFNNGLSGVNLGNCSGNVFVSNAGAAPVAEENCTAEIDVNICGSSPCL